MKKKAARIDKKTSPLRRLGPGLITGAADDDPSGIATYSQVGAQFGFGLLWTVLLTYPLMAVIQTICARIGRVSGQGLASNIRRHYPVRILYGLLAALLIANVINIAADISAMGAALKLLIGGPASVYGAALGGFSLLLQIFVPYHRYAHILKWMTLSLLSYVATIFFVHIPWRDFLAQSAVPRLTLDKTYITSIVAVFGTTISPYLFFWQASEEVEELRSHNASNPLRSSPEQAPHHLRRINIDTWIGMGFSNLVAFFIILTTAVTLNRQGITDVQTSSQAAAALKPVAGEFAFFLFGTGIIGTGLLALPVLAGSIAYAMAGTFDWKSSLELEWPKAKGFYAVILFAFCAGIALDFLSIDPIKALYWSAVINGVISVPFMVFLMLIATNPITMGQFKVPRILQSVGWLATAVMGLSCVMLLVTAF